MGTGSRFPGKDQKAAEGAEKDGLHEERRVGEEGKKARRSKGSVEDVREIRKLGDQTAGSQEKGNGENQSHEKLGKERDESESRRAEERWKAMCERGRKKGW